MASGTIALQIPDEVALDRLRRRAETEGRADDTAEAIQRRLQTYHRETAPLIEYYRTRGNLVPVHGDRVEGEVFREIQEALERVPAAEPPVRAADQWKGSGGTGRFPQRGAMMRCS